jgi:hypothetical protein
VAQSDAEQYLRLAGERAVLDRAADHGQPDDSALGAAGHALVAVGALTAGVAQAIVDDYGLALAYRDAEPAHFHHVRARRAAHRATPGRAQGPLRAVPCHRLIEQPWGQLLLGYVVLSDEATVLQVTMRPAAPPPGQRQARAYRGRRPGGGRVSGQVPGGAGRHVVGPGLPSRLSVTDDRGTTSTASFSGGGSDEEWRGQFEVRPPLAPDTAWVEVLGERIGLPSAPSAGVPVRMEPLEDAVLARRYLWVKLASVAGFGSSDAMETSIEALLAAGALGADDPAIGGVRAVAGGLLRGPGTTPGTSGTTPGTSVALPGPWRSVLARRGRSGGPAGLVVAGATTPPLDGFTLAILALHSTGEQFYIDVEAVPGLPYSHWPSGMVDTPLLAWWAADDRGHHYLGQQGEWRFSEDHSGGQIEFWPALDPAATVLDIMPTTMTARAVIRVSLDWGEDR